MKDFLEKQGKCILAMLIFGTIGIFVRFLAMPSSVIALVRGFVGVLFLFVVLLLKGQKVDFDAIRKNFVWIFVSGAFIGFNWILLFEAYRYTTVAVATLCYYMAPVIVILLSPIVQGERLTAKKMLCTLVALCGMICISGVAEGGSDKAEGAWNLPGIGLGLGAALLYAAVILINKKIKGVSGYDRTLSQIGIAAVVLLPYTLLACDFRTIVWNPESIFLLGVVGVVHTGIAYALYFDAVEKLPVQTTAIYSYIDPVTAVFLSVVLLNEKLGILGMVGMIFILGATFLNDR